MSTTNIFILILILVSTIIINSILLKKKLENFFDKHCPISEYDKKQNKKINDLQTNMGEINTTMSNTNTLVSSSRSETANILSQTQEIQRKANELAGKALEKHNELNAKLLAAEEEKKMNEEEKNRVKYGDIIRIKHKDGPTYLNKSNSRFMSNSWNNHHSYFLIIGKSGCKPVKYGENVYLRSISYPNRVLQMTNDKWGRFTSNNTGRWEKIRFAPKSKNWWTPIIKNEDLYIESLKGPWNYLQLSGGSKLHRDMRYNDRNKDSYNYWKTFSIVN